jgi:hypothetical protein
LIDYAAHLSNQVPSTHTAVIAGFLDRANLPDEVVAFAACVLDALSERFMHMWRQALAPTEFERDLKNFLRTDTQQHAHASPDVIVLAALALAHGFLIDRLRSSRHWAVKESDGMFSVREIEATKRAILEDMDYGLFRIGEEEVRRVQGEMKRKMGKRRRTMSMSLDLKGAAVWSLGVLTPEPSP